MGSVDRQNRLSDRIGLVMGPFDGQQNLMTTAGAIDREARTPSQIGNAPAAARASLGEGEAQAGAEHRSPGI
ncbi:MAG: hypothetical protein WCI65_14665 [Synechococcaceae cyanobacterium ELA263]|jgi:hypothetical protein